MKVSDYYARRLYELGVRFIFELSGGMITHLLDSVHRAGRIRLVSMHHEQGAAFAADSVGRLTGVPGVAMATSGPGATNLLTGIGSCYFDSTPSVFLTGQVNREERKDGRAIRQLGFQETDIVSVAGPITKGAWAAESAEDAVTLLEKAFQVAKSGRPGPVLLDLPMDVQRLDISDSVVESLRQSARATGGEGTASGTAVDELLSALRAAARPVLIAGGGIRASDTTTALREFVELTRVPVVHSLMGVDILPGSHPLRVGMLGSYGNRWANIAVSRSDFLLVLGSRLDIRQTGSDVRFFSKDRVICHVDCEPGEINNRIEGCRGTVADLRLFLPQAILAAKASLFEEKAQWLAEIRGLRAKHPDTLELRGLSGINPNSFMHALSAAFVAAGAYVVDVGQHQMWAAQSLRLSSHQRFLTSGGMGSMGFALPAAIGSAVVNGERPTVVIAGDGGFQCNIQELQTIATHSLPVKMVVLNNRAHGMVRQFQQAYFEGRYQSTVWGYGVPDLARVARAYGIPGKTIARHREIERGLAWLARDPRRPALLQVMIDQEANVYPKIAFGRPLSEMEPDFAATEIEGT